MTRTLVLRIPVDDSQTTVTDRVAVGRAVKAALDTDLPNGETIESMFLDLVAQNGVMADENSHIAVDVEDE